MNLIKVRHSFQSAGRLAALFAALFAATGLRAADPSPAQPGRFLLIFETSSILKKNLPLIRQELGGLFAGSLQGQIQNGDDLAVWTVDKELHAGTYPLASWSPEDAEMDCDRLNDFLGGQNFTRHASLAALQPALNHVVKTSERLTVLIFCDSRSPLMGTPYDSGVNEIVTNAAARIKGTPPPFILVLRSYHGEYLGCSVNRSGYLNFPKFPPPPKPEPPVVKAAPTPAAAPLTGPVVTPVPALIIVGTRASTNVADLFKPAAPATPAEIAPPPASPAGPAPATVPAPPISTPQIAIPSAPPVAAVMPANPTPAPGKPASISPVVPVPMPAPPKSTATEPAVIPPSPLKPAASPEATTNPAVADSTSADAGTWMPLVLGGGLLLAAVILVLGLVIRGRRPQGSLITSSMRDDPRLPPRK